MTSLTKDTEANRQVGFQTLKSVVVVIIGRQANRQVEYNGAFSLIDSLAAESRFTVHPTAKQT